MISMQRARTRVREDTRKRGIYVQVCIDRFRSRSVSMSICSTLSRLTWAAGWYIHLFIYAYIYVHLMTHHGGYTCIYICIFID